MSFLSLAIWLPILAGVVLLAIGRDDNARAVRWFALVARIASFLVTIPLITGFDTTSAGCSSRPACRGSNASTPTTTWAWTASPSGSCC